jgi:two-component system, chemotaxis family, chemotaxis protein CheY
MAKRILLVDDSMTIRQVEKLVLSGVGYDLLEACDGKDALARLQNTPVNLVLTDVNMPNLDGFGLIRALRAHPVHRLTPIIMVTTESAQEKRNEAKLAGATGWMVKPFSPDQLLAVVTRVLGKEKT